MSTNSELHIIAPGICGDLAEIKSLENNNCVKQWISVLSKAQCENSDSSFKNIVSSLFSLSFDGDLPSAALNMLAADKYQPSMNYMFADPVHLQADLDHAVLTSSFDLEITESEADNFCKTLNQHFDQDGLSFIKINRNQWVVASEESISLETTPLIDAIGRNINFLLPTGESSSYWKKKLTEAQMLMHSHEINNQRQDAKKTSINSLWLHGSGNLPESQNCSVMSIGSEDMLFKGLAKHVSCEFLPIKNHTAVNYMQLLEDLNVDKKTSQVNVLHLTDLEHLVNYTDVSMWSNKLEELLNNWIYPLINSASKKYRITLYPCNGKQYKFSKYDHYKFWRQDNIATHIKTY